MSEAAVHEVRYAVAGASGPHVHGAHLTALTGPLIGVICAALLAHVLLRAAVAPQRERCTGARLRVLWPLTTVAVLALFLSQEAVEAALSHHHQSLADTIAGGWAALPASAAAGAMLAVAARIRSVVAAAPRPGSHLLQPVLLLLLPWVSTVSEALRELLCGRLPDRRRSGRAPPAGPFRSLALRT